MKKRNLVAGGFLALLLAVAVSLVTPRPAEASIHEIIAALCRAGGEEVVPHGQNKDGQSFVRALQATGFISSIDTSDPTSDGRRLSPQARAAVHYSCSSSR